MKIDINNVIKSLERSYGDSFFKNIVLSLSKEIQCDYVFIATFDFDHRVSQTIALAANGKIADNFSYELKGTPCSNVADNSVCCYPHAVTDHFPKDQLLIDMSIESYIGAPLYDANDLVIGLVVALHSKPIEDSEDIVTIFQLFSSRIAVEIERKKYEKEHTFILTHELKTGLYNKKYLESTIEKEKSSSLLLLDINGFSHLNYAYGYDIADKLLLLIVEHLKNLSDSNLVAQVGADTFALLYHKETNIISKIEDIQNCFSHTPLTVDLVNIYISFSYGAAIGNEKLYRNASLALKKSKNKGNNRYTILDGDIDEQNTKLHEAFIKANNIVHQAISSNAIIPYFQGIRDNKTGEITKYEALIRIHLDGKVYTPYTFLESAKFSGMLSELTKIMIIKSCEVMAQTEHTFSINITEDDLDKNYLISYLQHACERFNINPERITLEILEGISSTGKESQINQLKLLRNCGYKIAIDDFGAEYSNFERVLDIEVDFLKIDAKYIKSLDKDKKSYEIVRAIAQFTQNTGIKCIAEFVESQNIQQILEDLGIEYSQGYLFSEPVILDTHLDYQTMETSISGKKDDAYITISIRGHYDIDANIPQRIAKHTKNWEIPFNALFDATFSDFFEIDETIAKQVAGADSINSDYKFLRKVALLVNDSHSHYMGQVWCDNLTEESQLKGKVFDDKEQAKAWLLS